MTEIWTFDRKAVALRELHEWHGTRHIDRLAIKGTGVDCINLVYEVLIESGVLERKPLGTYTTADGMNHPTDRLQRAIKHCCKCEVIPASEAPQFGDIAIFRTGSHSGHVGIFAEGLLWHALAGRGVTCSDLTLWRHAVVGWIRIVEMGLKADPVTALKC